MEKSKFSKKEIVRKLILQGLQTDGAHHKQWYLEMIAQALDISLLEIVGDYEEGIVP